MGYESKSWLRHNHAHTRMTFIDGVACWGKRGAMEGVGGWREGWLNYKGTAQSDVRQNVYPTEESFERKCASYLEKRNAFFKSTEKSWQFGG